MCSRAHTKGRFYHRCFLSSSEFISVAARRARALHLKDCVLKKVLLKYPSPCNEKFSLCFFVKPHGK